MNILINLDVDDLDKAIRFYAAAFGLSIGRRFGAIGAEMLGGPSPIYLLVKSAGTSASEITAQRRSYQRHWTPVHLDFVVDEIEPAIERAVSAGARLEQSVTTHKWGKLALLAAPSVTASASSSSSVAATTRLPSSFYPLNPTTRCARWDSGKSSPSHLSVTI